MRTLIEAIIRFNNMASKESIRYSLNGVSLDAVSGKYRVRATDGHAFVEQVTDLDAPSGFAARIIPSDAIAKLKLLLKNSPNTKDGFFIQELSKDRLKFGYGSNIESPVESCDVLCLDGEFPDTSHLSLETKERSFTFHLNPELLTMLFKSMNTDKKSKKVSLTVQLDGTLAPIIVSHGDLKGLLMPMKK